MGYGSDENVFIYTNNKEIEDRIRNLNNNLDVRGINVMYPAAPLIAFKGDGTPADLTAINNIINTAPDNSNIIVPNGIYKLNGALTPIKNGKQLIGVGKPTLDFSDAPDGVSGVTVDTQRLPIASGMRNFIIKGNGRAGTSVGLTLTGSASHLFNIELVYWGTGLNLNKAHMYINTFEQMHIHQCKYGIQFPDTTPDSTITDCGENLRFIACNISDNDYGFVGGLTTTDAHFHGCSIDYNIRGCQVKNGFYHFDGGHIETNIKTSSQDYYFDVIAGNSSSFSFNGTNISCYGIHNFFNPDPSIRGFANFYGCSGFARGTGDAADSAMRSQTRVIINAGQTTATVKHFLANSQLSMISVKMYITGGQTVDISTPAIVPTVKLTTGTNTLTITIPSAQVSNVFVMLDFG